MNRLLRALASPAALLGALTAGLALLLAWARRDARADLKRDIELKDQHHAKDIDRRVARDRADHGRLHRFKDRGWRD